MGSNWLPALSSNCSTVHYVNVENSRFLL